jgi:hypothetical protein
VRGVGIVGQSTGSHSNVGTWIIVAGLAISVIGLAVGFGWFSWFGHLPGDIRAEGETTRVFIPITSMLVVSVVLSVVLSIAAWLLRRLG